MARKRKLDRYVTPVIDRHGKERFRFRRNGFSCYLNPLAPDYRQAYDEANQKALGRIAIEPRAKHGTVNDLLPRFYESLSFKQDGYDWRKTRKAVLESFREEFGNDLVRDFEPHHIDVILARKVEPKLVDGKRVGGTHAAKRLREQLDLMFRFAIKQKWISTNPVDHADTVDHKVEGFHEWDEDEIARFRDHWALGTKPRLALELILWTGLRRGDARLLPPPKNGRFKGRAGKTGKEFDLPVAPPLAKAIEAMPAVGMTTLLVTEYGKPFSAAGFGNWFRDQCRKAGLDKCTAHGLRKALARRAAEQGVQQQGIKALGQWSGDREVALYVEGANRKRLAQHALEEVLEWEQNGNK